MIVVVANLRVCQGLGSLIEMMSNVDILYAFPGIQEGAYNKLKQACIDSKPTYAIVPFDKGLLDELLVQGADMVVLGQGVSPLYSDKMLNEQDVAQAPFIFEDVGKLVKTREDIAKSAGSNKQGKEVLEIISDALQKSGDKEFMNRVMKSVFEYDPAEEEEGEDDETTEMDTVKEDGESESTATEEGAASINGDEKDHFPSQFGE